MSRTPVLSAKACCAEATAIGVMVAGGEKTIAEVLVMAVAKTIGLVTPCGDCRQRLREFAGDDVIIHLCDPNGLRRAITLGELLPLSFGPDQLKPV